MTVAGTDGSSAGLARRLGLFDATMLVMGGIIGAGIFVNPAEVARIVTTPELIVGAWLIGGLVAIAGALVYAELAALKRAANMPICVTPGGRCRPSSTVGRYCS